MKEVLLLLGLVSSVLVGLLWVSSSTYTRYSHRIITTTYRKYPPSHPKPQSHKQPVYCDMSEWNGDGDWIQTEIPLEFNNARCIGSPANASAWAKWNALNQDTVFNHTYFQPRNCDLKRLISHDGTINGDTIEEFVRLMRGRKLIFLGDSLSLHHSISLGCLLRHYFGFTRAEWTTTVMVEGRDQAYCRQLTGTGLEVCTYRQNCFIDQALHRLIEGGELGVSDRDVIVVNTGAHSVCKGDPDPSPLTEPCSNRTTEQECVRNRVEAFIRVHRALQPRSDVPTPYTLWREYTARHYNTSTGNYCSSGPKEECTQCTLPHEPTQIDTLFYRADFRNWQNNVAAPVLKGAGVDVLPVWRGSYLVGPMGHPGDGDCTHYVSPEMLVYWNEVLITHLVKILSPI